MILQLNFNEQTASNYQTKVRLCTKFKRGSYVASFYLIGKILEN